MASASGRKAAPPGAELRALAARLVARVARDGQTADVLLEAAQVAPRDGPLLRALLLGTLRWHHRLQWQLDRLVTRPLTRKDAELAALVRIGLFQLQGLRVPAHAAVSTTVEATRSLGFPHARGLVNAVLRRYQRESAQIEQAQSHDEEARYSHPAWLIAQLRADWGEAAAGILEANNAAPPMWLRVNLRETEPEHYLAVLGEHGIAAQRSARLPAGVLLGEAQASASLPGYAEGHVSVQDGAAQLAAGYLALEPGLRVLDACAAPGGKTAHLLESCPGIDLLALDRDGRRLARVARNLERLHLSATLVEADALESDGWWDGRPFDRVLLDAPCSALGVIRRHPDIKLLRTPADVTRAAKTQALLLQRLWPLVAVHGRLVYATCTVLRRENQAQIAAFLASAPDAKLTAELQVLPGEANMDGFYYACLDKQMKP